MEVHGLEFSATYLIPSLLIAIVMIDSVNFPKMRFQRASLREGFATLFALIGSDA